MNKEFGSIRFPSDAKFLKNKDFSDLLFGYFSLYSQKDKAGQYSLEKKTSVIISQIDMSYLTYNKKVEALEMGGYIKKEDKKICVLYNNYKNDFKIPRETIKVLLNSKLNNIIKVFIILNIFYENKYGGWFTYKSLLSQIGYSKYPSVSANQNIKEILDYLEKKGLLKYSTEHYGNLGYRRFRIIEINKTIDSPKEIKWEWKTKNIDFEDITKKEKCKKEDIMYIFTNIGFPTEGYFSFIPEDKTNRYKKAIELALRYNLIKEI